MRVYGVGRVTEFALGPLRIRLRWRMSQYYSRSLGVGTLTIYDADMASQQSTSYGACVGSTLVRNSHSITQEWREKCTGGLFSLPVFLYWRCVGLWLQRVAAQVWMTIMQLNDVSTRSQKANSSTPTTTALPMTPISLHSTMYKCEMYRKCTESSGCGDNLTIQQSNSPTGICVLGGRESTWYRGTSFINRR